MVSYAELRQVLSRRELQNALSAGTLARVRRGHYALPLIDDHRRAAIATSGVLGGLSAAMHWGWKVKVPPTVPEVIVPRNRKVVSRRRTGIALRWADLHPDGTRGAVLGRVATVLDCASRLPFDEGLAVVDSALRAGLPKTNLLLAAHRLPRTGRARAIRVIELGDSRADNPFESVLRAALVGMPEIAVEPQVWVGSVGRADLVDVGRGIAIEADSHEFHASPEALLRDMERYNGFVAEGYVVLRFGWRHAMFDPDYVRAVVRSAARAHGRAVRAPEQ